jgi:hypothetical protein
MSKHDALISLENIEAAAIKGYIRCPLAALTARLLTLELANSETELDALGRAIEFIDSVKA